jgi:outer membrane protein
LIRAIAPTAFVLAAGLLPCGPARAETPDLMTVYQAAQDNDPTYRAARFALDIARQKQPEAFAALLPVVALTGTANSTQAVTQYSGAAPIDRDADSRNWAIQLTQPVFRVGNFIANRQATFVVEGAEAQFAQAQQDLIVRVAGAYFAVNESQDAITAADAQIAAMTEQLAQVTEGMKHGTRSMTDIDDTRTRLGSAQAQRVAALNDLESARSDLEKITGSIYPTLAPLQPTAGLPPPNPMDARAWMDQARDNHPVVRAEQAALEVAKLDVDKAQAEHLPTIDLVVSSGHNYSSHNLTSPVDYSTRGVQHQFGFQVTVPLFAGGAVVVKVAQAEGNRNKTEADLESARRGAASDAQHAFAGVTNGLAQVEALTTAVESGRNALKGNEAGFRVGVRANVDVLNAQQQLYAAQRDLSKARYEVLLQGLKLKAATGILGDQDVIGVNALLH